MSFIPFAAAIVYGIASIFNIFKLDGFALVKNLQITSLCVFLMLTLMKIEKLEQESKTNSHLLHNAEDRIKRLEEKANKK